MKVNRVAGARRVSAFANSQLSAVFINAFKEQQASIDRQKNQIDALKKLLCLDAAACK